MSMNSPQPPAPIPVSAPVPDYTARHLHQLERAAALGCRLLDILERHAEALPAPASPDAVAAIGLAYNRITRALRQTIALERHLRDPAPTKDIRAAERDARRQLAEKARHKRQKAHVRDLVAFSVGTDQKISDRESRLLELDERLDDEDMQQVLLTTPIVEIVSKLCDELGVTMDCSHWEDPMLADLVAYENADDDDDDDDDGIQAPATAPPPNPSG